MASFTQDEIFTATEVVRNFSAILDKVGRNQKIVVLKNNKIQAIMLNLKEYERLIGAVELLESIYKNQKA